MRLTRIVLYGISKSSNNMRLLTVKNELCRHVGNGIDFFFTGKSLALNYENKYVGKCHLEG